MAVGGSGVQHCSFSEAMAVLKRAGRGPLTLTFKKASAHHSAPSQPDGRQLPRSLDSGLLPALLRRERAARRSAEVREGEATRRLRQFEVLFEQHGQSWLAKPPVAPTDGVFLQEAASVAASRCRQLVACAVRSWRLAGSTGSGAGQLLLLLDRCRHLRALTKH